MIYMKNVNVYNIALFKAKLILCVADGIEEASCTKEDIIQKIIYDLDNYDFI